MGSFSYNKHTDKHIGVWLRYHSNPDIKLLVKESRLKRYLESCSRRIRYFK